jgi:hypothetical protein
MKDALLAPRRASSLGKRGMFLNVEETLSNHPQVLLEWRGKG